MKNHKEIHDFIKKLNETYIDYTFGVTFGRKYARVFTVPKIGAGKLTDTWGFIDAEGNIWIQPSGWNIPTKKFSRGNISEAFV